MILSPQQIIHRIAAIAALLVVLSTTGNPAYGQDPARLLRFPALSENAVVFSYAGDLYTVPRTGGTARKLTHHKGVEIFPRFSPDGNTIAFSGQYHGNTEVYTMPATGGTPKRITYTATLSRDDLADRMGPNNIVMEWKPGGKQVVYRSRRHSFNSFQGKLYAAPLDGGLDEQLPFSVAGWLSYEPNGNRLAYNRTFRTFRTWKYYKGGMAPDVYIFDPADGSEVNISNHDAQDLFPMWHGNTIYYVSDRDRTMNIFAYNLITEETRKVTNFKDFDVKFPSLGPDGIIFEKGGYLFILNLENEKVEQLEIRLADDFTQKQSAWVDASEEVNGVSIAPDGARALVAGRGDIWSVPAEEGVTRNLTRSSGSHERNAVWSPNGKHIAYIGDESGEFEIYLRTPGAEGETRQLTNNADTYKYGMAWSPDSRHLLWSDKKNRLRMLNVESGAITEISTSSAGELRDFAWSPDGKWIAYAQPERGTHNRVMLYNLETQQATAVTDNFYVESSLNFSRDGKFLLMTSRRDFSPSWSWTEWNHAYNDMARVYLLPLAADTPNPLGPENNEVEVAEENDDTDNPENKNAEEAQAEEITVTVDLEGIQDRLIQLPVKPALYYRLALIDNAVYYMRRKTGEEESKMFAFHLEEEDETEMATIDYYSLSADGKKLLLKKGENYYILDRPAKPAALSLEADHKLDMSNMELMVDLRAEWKQIYYESWRQMRDFFYVPNMHGVNWKKMRDKYAELLPHVNHRNDLSYIIGELIGELNVGHAYVGGGDRPEIDKVKMGLLGARLQAHSSGYPRIREILPGANWSKELRSPLTEAGVNVQQGLYLIAIDGQDVSELANPYQALIGKAGQQVEIRVNEQPRTEGSRTTIVRPLADESELYYYNWVQNNLKKVTEASNGEIGYIHIPDMVSTGLNQFARLFYPQLNKKGLIIDVRGNGGGNVSPMIIERLARELAMVQMSRNNEPYTNPFQMHLGPKAALLDRYTASDGDLFSYRFKKYGLGPLIGERSWGGVVGIRGSLPFIDGGYLRKPEFAPYDTEGEDWIIEGYGVEPDIKVDNPPHKVFKGMDPQLQRAIEEVKKLMEEQPTELPEMPEYPRR